MRWSRRGYLSLMGDRLECTDIWQSHHDRVTAEVPITVSDDQRLDMFPTDCDPCEAEGVVDGRLCRSCGGTGRRNLTSTIHTRLMP